MPGEPEGRSLDSIHGLGRDRSVRLRGHPPEHSLPRARGATGWHGRVLQPAAAEPRAGAGHRPLPGRAHARRAPRRDRRPAREGLRGVGDDHPRAAVVRRRERRAPLVRERVHPDRSRRAGGRGGAALDGDHRAQVRRGAAAADARSARLRAGARAARELELGDRLERDLLVGRAVPAPRAEPPPWGVPRSVRRHDPRRRPRPGAGDRRPGGEGRPARRVRAPDDPLRRRGAAAPLPAVRLPFGARTAAGDVRHRPRRHRAAARRARAGAALPSGGGRDRRARRVPLDGGARAEDAAHHAPAPPRLGDPPGRDRRPPLRPRAAGAQARDREAPGEAGRVPARGAARGARPALARSLAGARARRPQPGGAHGRRAHVARALPPGLRASTRARGTTSSATGIRGGSSS